MTIPAGVPGPVDQGRHDEPGHRRDGPDRQVDAAGQHRERLAPRQDRQRHGRPDDDADPPGADDPGSGQLVQDDQDHQQDEQRHDRPIAEQAPPSRGGSHWLRWRTAAPRHAPAARRIWVRLPSMTTAIRMTPCATVAKLESMFEERHVGPDQRQDHDRHDRAEHPAPTAGQAHPAEHDRRDAQEGVRSGHRSPDPRAGGEAQPRRAPRTGRSGRTRRSCVRPTGTPLRNAASRSLPIAYRDRPSRERRTGIQMSATIDDQDDARLRDPLVAERSEHEVLEPLRRPAAGRVEDEQRAAGPDERHRQRDHDVRHPRDDHHAAVDRAEQETEERVTPTTTATPNLVGPGPASGRATTVARPSSSRSTGRSRRR